MATFRGKVWALGALGAAMVAALLLVVALGRYDRPERFTVPDLVLADPLQPTSGVQFHFEDATERSGIDFHYDNGARGRLHLPETFGGGVALFDYDADGALDIYLVQGGSFPPDVDSPQANRLFRNNRDGTFTDVTDESGVGHRGYGQGCAVADYDNDGDPDLFVTNYGPDVLYRNNGDGTFTDVTRQSGLARDVVSHLGDNGMPVDETAEAGAGEPLWGVGCAFGDLDNDGDLDLYVANYAHIDLAHHQPCRDNTGLLVHCPPTHYRGMRDVLYRNNDDGTFTDVTDDAGIVDADGRGMGVLIADIDQDGRLDIYVANDQTANYYFRAVGPLVFEECGDVRGVAKDVDGQAEGSMGVAYGDVNGDGRCDLLVTNYQSERNTVYLSTESGIFKDSTVAMGLGPATKSKVAWGTQFVDFNNDGWLDLFVSNGHVDNVEEQMPVPYAMPAQLFANRSGRFVDVSGQAGEYFQQRWVGRGAAFGDLDNDGDLDIAVTQLPYTRSRFTLLDNQTVSRGNVLVLKLVGLPDSATGTSMGAGSNRDALGARLTAHFGERVLYREVIGGGSYLAASDGRVFLGLGEAVRIDRLEVRWPSGRLQSWSDIEVTGPSQAWELVEGREPTPLPDYQTTVAAAP